MVLLLSFLYVMIISHKSIKLSVVFKKYAPNATGRNLSFLLKYCICNISLLSSLSSSRISDLKSSVTYIYSVYINIVLRCGRFSCLSIVSSFLITFLFS